ncbi:M24 family metallopeptidase [Dactylosporangium sp. NPDC000555]|uniref:M24 family metallopeptidase n=1 Tax=Dactylosporangium sp. NPDC000555 TaxID=3154260 RepID=UPI00332C56D5
MSGVEVVSEQERAARLLAAEVRALELFDEVERRGLVAAGRRDREVSDAIRDLAGELFGVDRFWHKRIVRSGEHTLRPYADNPPDREMTADDIVFCDFGPILDGWEADLGRTFVLGDDPAKHRLRDDLATIFAAGQRHFLDHPEITGGQLFTHVETLAADAGWELGAAFAGHLVGDFPHERIDGDKVSLYITPGNDLPMRRLDPGGNLCHWILEVHLVDRGRGFGGFYEQLLDLQHTAG